MNGRAKGLVIAAGAVCALLILLCASALYTLQTTWFRNKIKEKIIAAVEQVSGGRVEIQSFDYHWSTLTADFSDFVVHGTENISARPLFEADRVSVGLRVVSVLKRNIDVASVVVSRPRIDLSVASDGSTNIPAPRLRRVSVGQGMQALLDLKIGHLEFNDGLINADLKQIPISFRGEDTSVFLVYLGRERHYDVKLRSRKLQVNSDRLRSFSGSIQANARLERDRLWIQDAVFRSDHSNIQTSGTLRYFSRPVLDLQLSANFDASDLAAITKFDDLGRGHLDLQGAAHYDENSRLTVQGKLVGRDVAYRIKSVDFKKLNVDANFLFKLDCLEINHFRVEAIGSTLSGRLTLKNRRDLEISANLAGLNTRAAFALVGKSDLPWVGLVSGPVRLHTVWNKRWQNVDIQSKLAIGPGRGGIPLSGDIDVTYRANDGVIEFAQSSLNAGNTRLSFSGLWNSNLKVIFDSNDLSDLNPVLQFVAGHQKLSASPTLLRNGSAHFDGDVVGPLMAAQLNGTLSLVNFEAGGQNWDRLQSRLVASSRAIQLSSLAVDQGGLHATLDGSASLENWTITENSSFALRGGFRGADMVKLSNSLLGWNLPSGGGIASGTLDLRGTVQNPRGAAQLTVLHLTAYGERLNQLQASATFSGDTVQITRGNLQAGPAELSFSGAYRRTAQSWRAGKLEAKIDSNGFPLASFASVRDYEPGLNAQFEIHGQGAILITNGSVEPLSANGAAALRNITLENVPYGNLTLSAGTRGQDLTTSFSGDLHGSRISGTAQVKLEKGNLTTGQIHLDRIQLSTLRALVRPQDRKLPFEGLLQGGLTFEGPLTEISKMHGTISIETLQLASAPFSASGTHSPAAAELSISNVRPVVFQYSNGVATVSSFQMKGRATDVTVSGSIPLLKQKPLQAYVKGSCDLALFQLFDPNVRASGESVVAASIVGTITDPSVNGTVQLKNGTLLASNFPAALTAVNGTLTFDRNRATIEKLTAQTGGGELSMDGFVTFGNGGPLIYRLGANAENVRVRYATGVSVTATSQLQLTGTSENSILSGTATISRVIFTPNTDVGSLLASVAAPTAAPSNEKDFLTGLQFDIHLESAPNLQVSTELSRDVEAEIDMRLRGTPDRPILLGSITANSGDIKAFGTKYTINHGEVNFVNAVKIEPVLDLDLQTQARGITVDITVSGTPGKLNINYRSDPPLQPRDIIALLTVGRAPNITSNMPDVSVPNDVTGLQVGADTVLGQAISPDSNRLSKLFGITNIKIDPMVQGITNTPQARLTIEQQISKQITVTYVTNLSETSEQIFRLEWAFSPQYSIVALRDDNGEFGIDIQYRKRFK